MKKKFYRYHKGKTNHKMTKKLDEITGKTIPFCFKKVTTGYMQIFVRSFKHSQSEEKTHMHEWRLIVNKNTYAIDKVCFKSLENI